MQLTITTTFNLSLTETADLNSLVLAEACKPFFMLPAYQQAWWKHLGHGELQIFKAFEGKKLVGFLPLYFDSVDGKKVGRIVGAVDESDYLDFLVNEQYRQPVYEAVIQELQKMTWDELWLESLPFNSLTHTDFAAAVKKVGWKTERKEQTVSPVVTLPETWETYLDSLETKNKKNFKRLLSSIGEEDEISYRVVTEPEAVAKEMPIFIKLHKASGPDKASFWNPARETFFIEMATNMAEQKVLKLYFLDVNGEAAATLLLFDWQNQFLLYNAGFDAYNYGHLGVSNALFLYTIKGAIRLKRKRYDFMRGNEAYKFSFGAKAEPVYDLIIRK